MGLFLFQARAISARADDPKAELPHSLKLADRDVHKSSTKLTETQKAPWNCSCAREPTAKFGLTALILRLLRVQPTAGYPCCSTSSRHHTRNTVFIS